MKKYISTAAKSLLIVATFCGAIFLTGIAFVFLDIPIVGLSNGKTIFQKTVAPVSNIKSIECSLFKGDGLIAKNTNFYTFRLVDGKKVTVTLYAYGKQVETEIVEKIKAFI